MEGGASLDRWTVTSLENIKREPRGFVFNIVEIDKKLPKQEKTQKKPQKNSFPLPVPSLSARLKMVIDQHTALVHIKNAVPKYHLAKSDSYTPVLYVYFM